MGRFKLEKSKEKEGWWVLTDTENLVVIKFKEHEFNESQKVSFLDDDKLVIERLGAQGMARVLREMGDYMFRCWYSIALPTPVFEFREDEENNRFLLIRNGSPRFVVDIQDECNIQQLSKALIDAGNFASKMGNRVK